MVKDYIRHKTFTVLVADEDNNSARIISDLLDMSSIDCILCSSFDEAKEVTKNITIHCAVIGYHLNNKIPGTTIVKLLKKEKPHIPIIVISEDHENIIKIGALEAGANVFMTKPVDHNDLIKIIKNALSLVGVYEDLENAENIILALTRAVELKDTYTEGHSHRVAKYSIDLYDYLDIEEDSNDRNALYTGCLLHDIGKLGIPDNILKSENQLSEEERKEVQKHSIKGFEVCKDLTRLGRALLIVRNHHEKIDGSGYPDNLLGDDIPLIVKISTISDIYDALTSKRSYRLHNTKNDAFKIIQKEVEEGKIDAYLFKKFKKMLIE